MLKHINNQHLSSTIIFTYFLQVHCFLGFFYSRPFILVSFFSWYDDKTMNEAWWGGSGAEGPWEWLQVLECKLQTTHQQLPLIFIHTRRRYHDGLIRSEQRLPVIISFELQGSIDLWSTTGKHSRVWSKEEFRTTWYLQQKSTSFCLAWSVGHSRWMWSSSSSSSAFFWLLESPAQVSIQPWRKTGHQQGWWSGTTLNGVSIYQSSIQPCHQR